MNIYEPNDTMEKIVCRIYYFVNMHRIYGAIIGGVMSQNHSLYYIILLILEVYSHVLVLSPFHVFLTNFFFFEPYFLFWSFNMVDYNN